VSAHIQCMVCMYVCMCVCMYVYVYVCICMLYMLHAPRRAAARGASGSALLMAPTPPLRTLPGRTRTQAVRARRLHAGVARACALQRPTIPASRACRQHVISLSAGHSQKSDEILEIPCQPPVLRRIVSRSSSVFRGCRRGRGHTLFTMEKEGCCADFTADKICRGRAGYWNFVCAPFVLVWKSLTIFCFPCLHVLFWRCAQPLQVLRRGGGAAAPCNA